LKIYETAEKPSINNMADVKKNKGKNKLLKLLIKQIKKTSTKRMN